MIKIFYTFILFIYCACSQNNTNKPMLWQITGNSLKNPAYLFGTFHTNDTKLNRFPNIVFSKLYASNRLYTEMAFTQRNIKQITRFSKMKYPISLKKRLHPKTRKLLLKYLIKYKLPYTLKSLKPFKTWAIALMLENNSKKKHRLFMDEKLVHYAKKKHIKCSGLETPKEQLHYFDSLTKQEQEQFLYNTLIQKNKLAYENALVSWYKKGEEKGFLALEQKFAPKDKKSLELHKLLIEKLLFERNERFTRRIDILLHANTKLSYFFAIGAGHMSDKYGILQKLKDLGYLVQKVN